MRVFDVQSATNTLPLVRSIVKDILSTGQELRRLVFNYGQISDSLPEYSSMNHQLHQYILELEELGCIYRDYDFSVGLVDFPALINANEVFLCWRSDEDFIEYYHGVREGYSQRKSIPEELRYHAETANEEYSMSQENQQS